MDFAFLPPEINSGRMYTGPGSTSLSAAASSWDSLAAELGTTAESYESVLSGLSLQWRGPASEAKAATAAHYMGWLQTTAEQGKQTAMQARAAAAAYEQAYAMTVPPPAVTANRTRLASLIATNLWYPSPYLDVVLHRDRGDIVLLVARNALLTMLLATLLVAIEPRLRRVPRVRR